VPRGIFLAAFRGSTNREWSLLINDGRVCKRPSVYQANQDVAASVAVNGQLLLKASIDPAHDNLYEFPATSKCLSRPAPTDLIREYGTPYVTVANEDVAEIS